MLAFVDRKLESWDQKVVTVDLMGSFAGDEPLAVADAHGFGASESRCDAAA
jgi:hypothetical protein